MEFKNSGSLLSSSIPVAKSLGNILSIGIRKEDYRQRLAENLHPRRTPTHIANEMEEPPYEFQFSDFFDFYDFFEKYVEDRSSTK